MQFTMWRKPAPLDPAARTDPPPVGEAGMRILRSRQELEEAWQRAADSERRLRNALRPRYSHYLGPKPGPDARAASWAPTSGRLGGDQALPGFPSDGETVMEGGPSA